MPFHEGNLGNLQGSNNLQFAMLCPHATKGVPPQKDYQLGPKKNLASESKHSGTLKKHKNMAKVNPSSSII